MTNEELLEKYFSEHTDYFTVYVVEQSFALNQGSGYFKQFLNKENIIRTESQMKRHINRVLQWIQKRIPNIIELVKNIGCLNSKLISTNLLDVITSLSKLFTVTAHQAAGPHVIDPIIIEENNVSPKDIAQLVELYAESIIQPTIIIVLRDNDFDRAKRLLAKCPHSINIKFIRNNGASEINKVINPGANTAIEFIDAFSRQCFSTCSRTKRSVLLNTEWSNNKIIDSISPQLFKVRSNLLADEKEEARDDIEIILSSILRMKKELRIENISLLDSLDLMTRLNRIYCLDNASKDIEEVLKLEKSLEIDLLTAYVYRYAHFIPNTTKEQQIDLLHKAYKIFNENNIADHAYYCMNNALIYSFYTDNVKVWQFEELQQKAINDVPGMVGMSIILNNAGVAQLYNYNTEDAIILFKKGLDYSKNRMVQKIGLQNNILIARACSYDNIKESEIKMVLNATLMNFSEKRLPFIAAGYIINLVLLALNINEALAIGILQNEKVKKILFNTLSSYVLGSGSLTRQLEYLSKYNSINSFLPNKRPNQISQISGRRELFIKTNGYNPVIFNAWL